MTGAPPAPSALRGMMLLAFGRPAGLALFRDTPEGFLASLAPPLALAVAGAVLLVLDGRPALAVLLVLVALVLQLAPPVLSHMLARAWGREARWLRYATARNWCQWVTTAFLLTLVLFLGALTGAPLETVLASEAFNLLFVVYVLWLQWLLARHGLGLGAMRAVGLVLLVVMGTAMLVFGPLYLRALLQVGRVGGF